MATRPVQPITTKQRLSGGQVVFKPEGKTKYVKIGVVPSFEFTPNLTEVESRSPEFGTSQLIGTFVTAKDGSISMTVESWTEWLYATLFMDDVRYLTQAETTGTLIIENVAAGDVVRLPGVRGSITALTDGDEMEPLTFVEDEHYSFHPATGFTEILTVPEGATTAEIDFSLPEITEADKLLDVGVMAKNGVRGELTVIGVTEDGYGDEVEQTYWSVELRPSGAVPAIATDAINQATLTGRVYAVSGKAAGKSYGQVRSLETIA